MCFLSIIEHTVGLLALIVSYIVFWGLRVLIDLPNPLRQPKEQIRESILEITPIGMSMDEVIRVIESNKKWKIIRANYEQGYRKPGTVDAIVGEKSIRANIGKYINFYETYVSVYWGFDEGSTLIDILVHKTIVGL